MAKTKSQASWNGLSPQQRRTLEEWLFDDGLSYDKALERAQKELGFKGTRSSLRRFYEERNEERTLLNFAAAGKMVTAVAGAPVSPEDLRDAGMKVAAQLFFKLVTERPEQAKDWLPLAKLLAQGERSTAWREVKDAENEIRRAALDFARTKHQYDMIGQALKALPELEEMAEAERDPEVTKFERNRRMNDLRKQMFGEAIPELLPETPEEEAHPELVERKMAEAKQRQREQWAREYEERQMEHSELRRRELERQKTSAGAGVGVENEGEDDPPSPGGSDGTSPPPPGGIGATTPPLPEALDGSIPPLPASAETEIVGHNPSAAGSAEAVSLDQEVIEQPAECQEEIKIAGLETPQAFAEEPRKLTKEERDRNYRELMRRARGDWSGEPSHA